MSFSFLKRIGKTGHSYSFHIVVRSVQDVPPSFDQVLVSLQRGKHCSYSSSATVKGGTAMFDQTTGTLLLNCTLYKDSKGACFPKVYKLSLRSSKTRNIGTVELDLSEHTFGSHTRSFFIPLPGQMKAPSVTLAITSRAMMTPVSDQHSNGSADLTDDIDHSSLDRGDSSPIIPLSPSSDIESTRDTLSLRDTNVREPSWVTTPQSVSAPVTYRDNLSETEVGEATALSLAKVSAELALLQCGDNSDQDLTENDLEEEEEDLDGLSDGGFLPPSTPPHSFFQQCSPRELVPNLADALSRECIDDSDGDVNDVSLEEMGQEEFEGSRKRVPQLPSTPGSATTPRTTPSRTPHESTTPRDRPPGQSQHQVAVQASQAAYEAQIALLRQDLSTKDAQLAASTHRLQHLEEQLIAADGHEQTIKNLTSQLSAVQAKLDAVEARHKNDTTASAASVARVAELETALRSLRSEKDEATLLTEQLKHDLAALDKQHLAERQTLEAKLAALTQHQSSQGSETAESLQSKLSVALIDLNAAKGQIHDLEEDLAGATLATESTALKHQLERATSEVREAQEELATVKLALDNERKEAARQRELADARLKAPVTPPAQQHTSTSDEGEVVISMFDALSVLADWPCLAGLVDAAQDDSRLNEATRAQFKAAEAAIQQARIDHAIALAPAPPGKATAAGSRVIGGLTTRCVGVGSAATPVAPPAGQAKSRAVSGCGGPPRVVLTKAPCPAATPAKPWVEQQLDAIASQEAELGRCQATLSEAADRLSRHDDVFMRLCAKVESLKVVAAQAHAGGSKFARFA